MPLSVPLVPVPQMVRDNFALFVPLLWGVVTCGGAAGQTVAALNSQLVPEGVSDFAVITAQQPYTSLGGWLGYITRNYRDPIFGRPYNSGGAWYATASAALTIQSLRPRTQTPLHRTLCVAPPCILPHSPRTSTSLSSNNFTGIPLDSTGYFSAFGRVRVCDGDGQPESLDWVRQQ